MKKVKEFRHRIPKKLRKYGRLMRGLVGKTDLLNYITSILQGLESLKVEHDVPVTNAKGRIFKWKTIKIRRYRNLPSAWSYRTAPRKVLTGIYGSLIQTARAEGLV